MYSQFIQFCLIAIASNNLHRLYRHITLLPSLSVTAFVFHLYSIILPYFVPHFLPPCIHYNFLRLYPLSLPALEHCLAINYSPLIAITRALLRYIILG